MAAMTTTPKQPSTVTVRSIERGALMKTLPPKVTVAPLNTPPAAAIHSMASAKNMKK
jgi:hypothetical protein